ncbi:MAG: hypothetical protein IPH62_17895 [Ignavibacteriae bacterium]|nr:hypothetical protein [Ignavibacteriota bacterium]
MQETNLFAIYTNILAQNNIDYFITGSIASIVYGDPRMTHDIDLIISLNEYEINKFISAFKLEEFYCPPREVILEEIKQKSKGHFNLIHHETGFRADIYLIGDDKFQHWAMQNKVEVEFLGGFIYVAPIEYIIIKKMEFYKEGKSQKHLIDIKGILENSKSQINFSFLNNKIKKFELNEIWTLIDKM